MGNRIYQDEINGSKNYRPTQKFGFQPMPTTAPQVPQQSIQQRLAAARERGAEATGVAQQYGFQPQDGQRAGSTAGDANWYLYKYATAQNAMNGAAQQPPPPGNNPRSGRGGGGGLSPAVQFAAYAQQLAKLLQAQGKNPFAGTFAGTAMIDPAVDADKAAAAAAFNQVGQNVSLDDPYMALRQQVAAQADPGLAALAQSQGVGAQQQAAVQAAQAQNQNSANNWGNLAAALGINHVAGQQNVLDVSKQQAAQVAAALEAQRTALKAQAAMQQQGMDTQAAQWQAQQDEARKQAMMQLLAAGLQYGQMPDLGALGLM